MLYIEPIATLKMHCGGIRIDAEVKVKAKMKRLRNTKRTFVLYGLEYDTSISLLSETHIHLAHIDDTFWD
jgi:hypothetical protein